MIKFFLALKFIFFALTVCLYSQNANPYDRTYRKKFAAYLFLEKDYLRAALEFESAAKEFDIVVDDASYFLCAVSYARLGLTDKALDAFSVLRDTFLLKYAIIEKNLLSFNSCPESYHLRANFNCDFKVVEKERKYPIMSLALYSSLLDFKRNDYIKYFIELQNQEKNYRNEYDLFKERQSLRFKDENTAAILSLFLPGAGKLYLGEYIDAAITFASVTGFAWLSYYHWQKNNKTEKYAYATIGIFFYISGAVGSYGAAARYNNLIIMNFKDKVIQTMRKEKYYNENYQFLIN